MSDKGQSISDNLQSATPPFSLALITRYWGENKERIKRATVPFLLIIIIIFAFSIHSRTSSLPFAERITEVGAINYHRSLAAQKPGLISGGQENAWALYKKENAGVIERDIKATLPEVRAAFMDSEGNPYMMGVDSFHYFRQARNIARYGTVGTEIKDGKPFDAYKLAPVGGDVESNLHPYVAFGMYRLVSLFSEKDLLQIFRYISPLIAALTALPAFFIGRRLSGNFGGFIAGLLVSINYFFVARVAKEGGDTDPYVIFFSVLAAWLFLETIEVETWTKKIALAITTGLSIACFAFAWAGWWIIPYFISGSMVILILGHVGKNLFREKRLSVSSARELIILLIIVLLSSLALTAIITDPINIKIAAYRPIGFLFPEAVHTTATKIWPNVLSTVEELRYVSIQESINGVIGTGLPAYNLFIFVLGVVGLLLTPFYSRARSRYAASILFIVWLGVMLSSVTKGIRFSLLIGPPIALGAGFFFGYVYALLPSIIEKSLRVSARLARPCTAIALVGVLLPLITIAYNPAYTVDAELSDAWWDLLIRIRDNSSPDAIITSWWDKGHWFKAIADRPTTFDGGSQNTPQAYWVARFFLMGNETKSLGMLRMLNCGGNSAFDAINDILQDAPRSVELIHDIVGVNKKAAAAMLLKYGVNEETTTRILEFTHCNPPESFVIASDDMVVKFGAIAHIGLWNVTRAAMVKETKGLRSVDALRVLEEKFKLPRTGASEAYQNIVSQERDSWIAPWPTYNKQYLTCEAQGPEFLCRFDLEGSVPSIFRVSDKMNITFEGEGIPASISFLNNGTLQRITYPMFTMPLDVLLILRDKKMMFMVATPPHGASLFARIYFYDGIGLQCFTLFDQRLRPFGDKILVFKVNWNC